MSCACTVGRSSQWDYQKYCLNVALLIKYVMMIVIYGEDYLTSIYLGKRNKIFVVIVNINLENLYQTISQNTIILQIHAHFCVFLG